MQAAFLQGLPTDAALDRAIAAGRDFAFVLPFELRESWRGADAHVSLFAAYFGAHARSGLTLNAFVTTAVPELPSSIDRAGFAAVAKRQGAALLDFDQPFVLEPVCVPKPWGRELWFTGMEARGVSSVRDAGGRTPLPWALATAPRRLCAGLPITLLKTLDPLPVPVHGDLYFELHHTKREVYVVTHVDPVAWPNSIGNIRYGMNQRLRRSYSNDAAFRAAYLDAVQQYEVIRRAIDERLDRRREAEGLSMDDALAPSTSVRWTAELGHGYAAEEQRLRDAMDAFTDSKALALGDVISVPVNVPHALQHGVRVLEFQTPTYERQILSFGQKVLTQRHWDTATAVSSMTLDVPDPPAFAATRPATGVACERIVEFEDFCVDRVRLSPGAELRLAPSEYTVAVGVLGAVGARSGAFSTGSIELAADTACLFPGSVTLAGATLHNRHETDAMLLLANPAR